MPLPSGRSVLACSVFYLLFLLVILAEHCTVLSLPYFWDELGQFVPAALDIFQQGAWVPRTTLPNVHPPGVMAYLAGVWKLLGYSIVTTRIAMLSLAALGVLGTFLLAIEMTPDLPGRTALIAPVLLLCSPLFWSQSMMAQLDMPAMVVTCAALILFLRGYLYTSAAVCTLLVLVKETSIVVPLVFACALLAERRLRQALLFLLPAAALAGWLIVLKLTTGYLLGNKEFTHYNVWFQFHPVRLPLTLLRRLFYLLMDNFHGVGAVAVASALFRHRYFRSRSWVIILSVAVLQILVVSCFGGAALERYLLPALPLFYVAVAAAFCPISGRLRLAATVLMMLGLSAGIVINSPIPYPFENNAAFVTFVRLQKQAARFVETHYHGRTIVSAWPLPDALSRPEFGYVQQPLHVLGIENFNPETLLPLSGKIDVFVVYSRTWEPTWGVLGSQWVRKFLADYYFYKPQITARRIQTDLRLIPVTRWEEHGQWAEVYAAAEEPDRVNATARVLTIF